MFAKFSCCVMAVLVLAAAAASVQATPIDGSVFSDEFIGTEVDTTKWSTTVAVGGTISVADGLITFNVPATYAKARVKSNVVPLDFSSSPNDWWGEMRFKMNDHLSSTSPKLWQVFSASEHDLSDLRKGFDLRARQEGAADSTTFELAWYGDGSLDYNRVAENLMSGLNKGQFYIAQVHRKTDGNVDIYLDDTLIATKPLIGAVNPGMLHIGASTVQAISGVMVVDYVRLGQVIPEPGTLALLATGLLGFLAYAWRKRKVTGDL